MSVARSSVIETAPRHECFVSESAISSSHTPASVHAESQEQRRQPALRKHRRDSGPPHVRPRFGDLEVRPHEPFVANSIVGSASPGWAKRSFAATFKGATSNEPAADLVCDVELAAAKSSCPSERWRRVAGYRLELPPRTARARAPRGQAPTATIRRSASSVSAENTHHDSSKPPPTSARPPGLQAAGDATGLARRGVYRFSATNWLAVNGVPSGSASTVETNVRGVGR